jgi:menaquinone-dependent protoporphyrinogen IX oxidase
MSVQKLLVVYATIHGHAASIARRIADAAVRAGGVTADVHDVAETLPSAVEHYDAVVLVGSVHHGTHPRILQRFAGAAADALRNRRTAFVSVTLSTATKEAYEDAADTVFEFFQETQWVPQNHYIVSAGARPLVQAARAVRQILRSLLGGPSARFEVPADYAATDWSLIDEAARDVLHAHETAGMALSAAGISSLRSRASR